MCYSEDKDVERIFYHEDMNDLLPYHSEAASEWNEMVCKSDERN